MSMFLPDGPNQTQPLPGVADIAPGSTETTSADVALMQRVLSAAARNPNLIPADFMAYVLDWIQTQRLTIPIGQVFGFSGFTASFASQDNVDTTSATSLGDCTNAGHEVGPELTGLADGKYVFFYGALAVVSIAGNVAAMNIEFNGSARGAVPQAGDAEARGTSLYSIASGQVASLKTGGANTVKAVYAVDSATVTGDFGSRWLMALKYANL